SLPRTSSMLDVRAPASTYSLSLHDALPISGRGERRVARRAQAEEVEAGGPALGHGRRGVVRRLPRCAHRGGVERIECGRALDQVDRKSTRLNSSHGSISYAVFCFIKKKLLV